jgi:ABC-type sugar transport system substrate-binding protein
MKQTCYLLILLALLASGCRKREAKYTIAFVPKIKNIPYFQACQRGAEEAGAELGLNVVYDGPTKAEAGPQIDFLKNWMESGQYNCFAVACADKDVSTVLREARQQKLPVVTYDADSEPDARQFFVNMATYDAVAEAMVDALLAELGPSPKGKVGILTSFLTAPNQSEWARRVKALLPKKAPGLTLLPEETHGEDRDQGVSKARALIEAHHDKGLVGIIGLTSVAVPAAAEATRQLVRQGVIAKGQIKVTGVSTPRDMADYVKDDTVKSFILWSPVDLGYLTVHVCDLVRKGQMPRTGKIKAGRLGEITVTDGEVLLGPPLKFTKENIGKYDF